MAFKFIKLSWEVIRASELPQSLHFKDYSDLAISSEYKRVAVRLIITRYKKHFFRSLQKNYYKFDLFR
jgi:hypothetical protein